VFIKKAGGKIFGAALTSAERKALNIEVQKTVAEINEKNLVEMDAIILWVLHDQFGFGIKRLRQFFDVFEVAINDLNKRYEMDDDDKIWMCTRMLKDIGIDIKVWHEEKEAEKNGRKSDPTVRADQGEDL
jgi:hypothetical protein